MFPHCSGHCFLNQSKANMNFRVSIHHNSLLAYLCFVCPSHCIYILLISLGSLLVAQEAKTNIKNILASNVYFRLSIINMSHKVHFWLLYCGVTEQHISVRRLYSHTMCPDLILSPGYSDLNSSCVCITRSCRNLENSSGFRKAQVTLMHTLNASLNNNSQSPTVQYVYVWSFW